jgi:hypothetical protein
LEGCLRAYVDGGAEPLMVSSGLEDYFLGTYYFNRGTYHYPLAGVTHLVPGSRLSAYRLHEDDPVYFADGLRLTLRCGDEVAGQIIHDPRTTRYTTYVWTYQWGEH